MQDCIKQYRKELPVVLLQSPHNTCKSMKRIKRLSESAKEESAKAEDAEANGGGAEDSSS